jgi:hypothetical protein
MSIGRQIGSAMLVVFIIIQFIQPAENKTAVDSKADLVSILGVPANVANILKNACYDCHSNYTSYPWYASVQPLGWLLAKHIKEGKEALNFNEFGNLQGRRQQSKIKAIYNSVRDGSMPLGSYKLLHPEARLSNENKTLIMDWAAKSALDISTKKKL